MTLLTSIDSAEWKSEILFGVYFEIRFLLFAVEGPHFEPWMIPEFGKLIEKWWYAGQLPPDVHQYSYSFEVGCREAGVEVSVLKVTVSEKRYRRLGKVPLSFFALIDDKQSSITTSNLSRSRETPITPRPNPEFPILRGGLLRCNSAARCLNPTM